MSKVSIELDLEVVQRAVNAKVAPAVTAILATVDLPALIEKALLVERPPADRYSYLQTMWAQLSGSPRGSARAIDCMVDQAIYEAAKNFVENSVEAERHKLEAAFEKALRASTSKLAKTMVGAVVDGIDSAWRFEMVTKITAKEPERDYSD